MRALNKRESARKAGAFSLALCGLLAFVAPVAAEPNIVQSTQSFDMMRPIAPTKRWTQRTSGLCGQTCKNGPRQMYSASFGDALLMSWMAIDETVPVEQTGWVQYGNVSTFTVSAAGEFSLVDTVSFEETCEAIFGITSNADGSIVSVLCKGYPGPEGSLGAELLPGAIDLLDTVRTADCDTANIRSCYPIGHYCPTASPLYIFEYTAAVGETARVSDTPDRIIRVNHAIGGWNYGHHEFLLNEAEDTYFLALKVVSNGCDHEGLKHFGVKRTPSVEYVRLTDEWACSGGHTEGNRLAYNKAKDYWSLLCTNDLCDANQRYVSGRCKGVDFSSVPGTSYQGTPAYHEGEELLSFEVWDKAWNLPGGGAAIVSLGDDGWLALALAPDGTSPYEERLKEARAMGFLRLPLDGADLLALGQHEQFPIYETSGDPTPTGEAEARRYDWRWLSVADASDGSRPRFGSANLAYFDTAGEASERLLLGWSPSIATQGITSEYVVSEVDREGQLRGEPLTLDTAGWGEDNRWVTVPSSGCVVFPFAWSGDGRPGANYPIEGQEPTTYPTVMHLTALCPVGEQPPLVPWVEGPSPYVPVEAETPIADGGDSGPAGDTTVSSADGEQLDGAGAGSSEGCGCTLSRSAAATGPAGLVLTFLVWGFLRRRREV